LYSGQATSEQGGWSQYVLEEEHELDNLEELLGHIFRATYQILKFIYTSSSFDPSQKRDLVNYLRAQMSEVEFLAFALTGATSIGIKSRALSIALNLYERRLNSIYWATGLRILYDAGKVENSHLASAIGYPVLDT
ncbi:MAG: putative phage abortive infection protein, partial [Hylemonella sp.]